MRDQVSHPYKTYDEFRH